MPFHSEEARDKGLFQEAKDVLDPTKGASQETEAALRAGPITMIPTRASDAVDFVTGQPTSPNPAVGGGVSVGRQFDETPGGGFGDDIAQVSQETVSEGTQAVTQAFEGAGSALGDVGEGIGSSIPWNRILLVIGAFLAINAFFGGAGEGIVD